MNENIAAINPLSVAGQSTWASELQFGRSVDFSKWLSQGLSELNQVANDADKQMQSMALGEVDNLHHVMIGLEKAKITFQLAVQIRNKLLEGYQDIMRMQV